jgi:hypothetical protein
MLQSLYSLVTTAQKQQTVSSQTCVGLFTGRSIPDRLNTVNQSGTTIEYKNTGLYILRKLQEKICEYENIRYYVQR